MYASELDQEVTTLPFIRTSLGKDSIFWLPIQKAFQCTGIDEKQAKMSFKKKTIFKNN
jgi:hypothetical protein